MEDRLVFSATATSLFAVGAEETRTVRTATGTITLRCMIGFEQRWLGWSCTDLDGQLFKEKIYP